MKIILIFSEPRSGGKILCESMEMWRPLRILWDALAPDGHPLFTTLMESERSRLAEQYGLPTMIGVIGEIHKDLPKGIEVLANTVSSDSVIKIHSYHIGGDPLIAKKLIDHPCTEIIVLRRRNSLKQYVSFLKALATDRWGGVDTTDVKVEVDLHEYQKFTDQMENWYGTVEEIALASGKEFLRLEYESHLEMVNDDPGPLISELEPWMISKGLPLERTGYAPHKISKQDRARLEESITNFEEVNYLLRSY